MIAAEWTGQHEYFTIDDVAEVTRESPEEVYKRVQQLERDLQQQGKNPGEYFLKINRSNLN